MTNDQLQWLISAADQKPCGNLNEVEVKAGVLLALVEMAKPKPDPIDEAIQ
ncbi:MAG: hypothetical protein GY696_25140 [Gammaproteobacteria bacterium]|nr:hypothetical protein [Gammaproteobacteria bacterium]